MLLGEYKDLATTVAKADSSASQCRADREQLRLQLDRTANELRQAKAALAASREEVLTARENANRQEELKNNLLSSLTWAYRWIKLSRIKDCPETARKVLSSLPGFSARSSTQGAEGRSSVSVVEVVCTDIRIGESACIFLTVSTADGDGYAIRDKISSELQRLLS